VIWRWRNTARDMRKIVVGLGNPGRKYARTRHNVGFDVLARVGEEYGDRRVRSKFRGEVMEATIDGIRTVLLCPQTYMNLSGISVQAAVDFYKLPLADLLVVCDDFALPLGRLRCRPQGSSGGQKGLEDIITRLKSNQFARLRVGIGLVPAGWNATDFVLGHFATSEQALADQTLGRAARAVADWVVHGTESCMNQYNSG
jgi:PTH1 family peptidyl-tRNA hydrolase